MMNLSAASIASAKRFVLLSAVVLAQLGSGAHARYRQPDPAGIEAGPNRFLYAESSPFAGADPTGEWMYWVHRSETINGAAAAGMPLGWAKELADLVVWADKGTQARHDAHRHAMCAQYRGRPHDAAACKRRYDDFLKEQFERCDLPGLANAIHAIQDSLSPAHEGLQPYNGLPVSPIHMAQDMAPDRLQAHRLRQATRQAIEQWRRACSCRNEP